MATASAEIATRAGATGTPAERAAEGRAARRGAPRSSHGDWGPAADRPDPVDVLERQAADRIAELVPLRYGRMLVSPLAFYRGAAAIMAADLGATPASGFWVQACGDAHLSNFGAYASLDRELVVDINDFDETLPAPWEWDVKRLAASIEIAGRERGFGGAERRRHVTRAAAAYRETMHELAAVGNLELWYRRVEVDGLRERFAPDLSPKEVSTFDRGVAKARRKDRLRALSKLTRRVEGELRLASDPPVLVPLDELYSGRTLTKARRRVAELVDRYGETLTPARRYLLETYRYVDAARKVVGVGSVGTHAWIALFVGRDESDPLFLQIKEAQASVLEPYTAPTAYPNQGQRVVEGQRQLQAVSGFLLGWLSAEGTDDERRDFYVRQLWDQKGSAVIELMSPARMSVYAEVCGAILARAHARSGDRIAIAGYLGRGTHFDDAIASFAHDYADQNERDFDGLKRAAADGRIAVERE